MRTENLIKSSGSILINKPADNVFAIFANPDYDSLWRTEINKSLLDGALQMGVHVSEYSNLSKKASNNLLVLKCVEFEKNRLAVFETPGHQPFYIKSERLVKPTSNDSTEIVYTISFDKRIVKFAKGFSLPSFIVSLKANSDLKKYLKQLKKYLESI